VLLALCAWRKGCTQACCDAAVLVAVLALPAAWLLLMAHGLLSRLLLLPEVVELPAV
jgi:hypothetical protein